MSKIYNIKHNRSHKSKNFAQRLLSINTKTDAHEHFIMSPVSMEVQRTSEKKFCEIKWMMYVCRMNVYSILTYMTVLSCFISIIFMGIFCNSLQF